jgi:hypothetical protein
MEGGEGNKQIQKILTIEGVFVKVKDFLLLFWPFSYKFAIIKDFFSKARENLWA